MSIPAEVMGLGGLITVKIVKKLKKLEGKPIVGEWDSDTRTIELLERSDRLMISTLRHELFHAALDDSGVCNFLSETLQETLCDLSATAREVEGLLS